MSLFSIPNIKVSGISACLPKNEVANVHYEFHSPLENQQFIKTTGIESRRVLDFGATASDLCFKAANQLIGALAWSREEINVLIFISQTPDYKIPNTASILQNQLGLPKSCLAFDVNLGCSGYVYGLSIISSLLEKVGGKGLLLVGDASTTCVHPQDKSTAPLFSDAGSATAIEYDSSSSMMYFNLQTDGSGFDAILTKDGGARFPFKKSSLNFNDKTGRRDMDMYLDGIKVFNFSRREVVPNILAVLDKFSIERDSIDFFIFHQANKLMNDSLAKKLNLGVERVPSTLREFGNTGSASIPVTICKCLSSNTSNDELKVLLAGFGVGLSWGSAAVGLRNCKILPLIEL